MNDLKMEAEIIFESHLPDALRQALEYAGEDGYVASMAQLLHARVNAPYDNEIWNYWAYTSNSEENTAKTPQGNRVVVTVHGGGIFATPERFKKLYHSNVNRFNDVGYTGLFAAKISAQEARDVVEGKLPDGTEIPLYPFDEFKQGVRNLPRRYAVVMDFETAKNSKTGSQTFDELKDDPLMIVRAGGVEAAAAYLDRARDRNHATLMGSWHSFGDIDPDQPQARILFMAGNEGGATAEQTSDLANRARGNAGIWSTHYRTPIYVEYGLRGDSSMINTARYVAVAPRNEATSVRYLPFVA
jgi:hypothetical protein